MTQLGQLYEKEKIEYANQKVREKAIEIAKSLLEDGTEIVKITPFSEKCSHCLFPKIW